MNDAVDPAAVAAFLTEPDAGDGHAGVLFAERGGIARITLSRPEARNALGLEAWRALPGAFAAAAGARAVVVRGAGEAFSAGADIAQFAETRMRARAALDYNRAIAAGLAAASACPVPVVAMIHGAAVGGGLELAAACDVRLAAADARLGIPIGRLGVTLGIVEARALARLVGAARLKELVFSGRLLDGAEAAAIGLVERVVAPEQLVRETAELLAAIAAASPATIAATKRVAALVDRDPAPAEVDGLAELLFTVYEGDDLREGVAAFLERRPPRFAADGTAPEVSG